MNEASKKRIEEINNKHFHGSTVLEAVTEAYQAGMQDPDAGKHECDDVCLQDMNLECPVSYPKELIESQLVDDWVWFMGHVFGKKKRVDWGTTFDVDWGRINAFLLKMSRLENARKEHERRSKADV